MRSKRDEFSKRTKLEAWDRCKGRCECGCGLKIIGTPEYDHATPASIGGGNELSNCVVMDRAHHRHKTSGTDVPQIARTKRLFEKSAGVRQKRGGFRKPPPGYDAWNRRMRDE